MKSKKILLLGFFLFFVFSCQENGKNSIPKTIDFGDYTLAELKISIPKNLSKNEQATVKYLIRAAGYADSIFLLQSAADYIYLSHELKGKNKLRFDINFGPWDRFHNNLPFIDNIPTKPKGAFFYPTNMIKQEFYKFKDSCKYSNFTVIRRNNKGELYCIPYHQFYKRNIDSAIFYIKKAAEITSDTNLKNYLLTLISSLKTDYYYPMYKKFISLNSKIQFLFGPINISEDKLLNIKAEHQSFVLIKNDSLSRKLNQYVDWLRYLQKALPVPEKYRREEPGEKSIIAVYDAIFLGGSAHAGTPLIATTIPFNTRFQTAEGTKNLQFINIINAKYTGIMSPLAQTILIKSQRKYVTPQAFQDLNLLYEIGNSLGIRNTINGKGSVREALKEFYNVSQYIKNYLMVLFLAEKLHSVGELPQDLKEYYYTFVVNLIRGIRWGTENDYGLANLVIFNYLYKSEAIDILPTAEVIIHYDQMKKNIETLLNHILILQGNGDYINIAKLILTNKYLSVDLQKLLQKIKENKIPSDIYIEQDK